MNAAVIDSLPELVKEVVQVVVPVEGLSGISVHDIIGVPPSKNVTVPEAAPEAESTFAVKVTLAPLATEDVDPVSKVEVEFGGGGGGADGVGVD